MASQAFCSFPGLAATRGWDMTFSPGVQPSTCVLQTVPQARPPQTVGELRLSQDGVTLRFPDAQITQAVLTKGQSGTQWRLVIQDRRWKWRFGGVSGSYNVKSRKDGKEVIKREKTPQELARLLLKQMDEQGYTVSALPNDSRPTVNWQAANPADELSTLCDSLGCYVVLNPLSNKVEIHRIGQGRGLPSGGRRIDASYPVRFRAQPDELRVVTGPVLFQSKFKLGDPVGVDTDGKLKKLDDLSYKPTDGGWEQNDPYEHTAVSGTYERDGDTLELYELAKMSVWKMYRITGLKSGGWVPQALAGSKYTPGGIDDIGFRPNRISQKEDTEGELRDEPAEITGEFDRSSVAYDKAPKGTPYKGSFSIDSPRGLVIFSDPVYRVVSTATGTEYKPAVLELETSYTAAKDGVLIRHDEYRKSNGQTYNTGPHILPHPEIVRKVIDQTSSETSPSDNVADVKRACDYYLRAAAERYQQPPAADVSYSRLVGVSPDGVVRQITWSGGGGRPATTRISLSQDHNPYVPRFEEVQAAAERNRTLDRLRHTTPTGADA